MGRVERRMYKQRKRRRWRLILLGLMMGLLLPAWKLLPTGFITELMPMKDKASPGVSAEQKAASREVTLPEDAWYTIQTGVFSTEEAARQKADAYTSRGAPGTVVRDGEKWRVFIACYETEADASSVRSRLEANQHVDTYLYTWSMPEVRLRLTGKASQIDAVEAGFTLLISLANTLRDAAIDLDAAQITNEEAVAAVQALDESVGHWEDTVHRQFGKNLPELVKSMLTMTGNWDKRCAALEAAGSATELSAALKAQAMGMYDEMIAWRNDLLAQ